MMYFVNALHVIFIFKLLQTDASVTINPIAAYKDDNVDFECGEELTLTCRISSNPTSMTWQNDSSTTPVAFCISGSCSVHPDVKNEYTFTQDIGKGIFNLTFDVTNYNNGTTYKCGDSSNFNTTFVSMRDYRPTLSESNQTKQLNVSSGCVSSSVNVTFSWKKRKNNTLIESKHDISGSKAICSTDSTLCASDLDCGGPDLITKSMSLEEEHGGSDDYFLKAILSYDGVEMASSWSSQTFKIKDSENTTKPQTQTSSVHNNTSYYTQMPSTTTNKSDQDVHQCVWINVECWYFVGMGLCFTIHIIVAVVFAIYILSETDRESCFYKTYEYVRVRTALSALPIHVLLVLSAIKWWQCSCTNPCLYCEVHCILRYCWIAICVVHYLFGVFLIEKIRKSCTAEKKNNRDAQSLKDVDILTITIYFVPFTYFILICNWISFKLKKENGNITPDLESSKRKGNSQSSVMTALPSERNALPSIPSRNAESNIHQQNVEVKKNTALKALPLVQDNAAVHGKRREIEETELKRKENSQESRNDEKSSGNRNSSEVDREKLTDQIHLPSTSNNQTERKSKKKRKRSMPKKNITESSFSNNEGYSLTKETEQQNTEKHVNVKSSERRGISTNFDDPKFKDNLSNE